MASVLMAGTVLVSATTDKADAAAGDRALNILNVHTRQQATVVFKRGGRYDPAGLKQLNYLLRDWRKDQPTNMDPHLFDLIWEVYKQSGSRQPINVVCGYRSPATNSLLRSRSRGVAQHSQHMLGKAMDFYLPDVPLPKLRAIGLRMQVGGVGFYPTSGSPFVHMDTGSVRHWPKMTRDQLVRVFPDGKTLHVPSDGRPLPGYQQALAEYKSRKANGGAIVMASADSPKGKSWLAKLTGGGADEQEDAETALPDVKVAAAAVPADEAAPVPAPEAKPATEADVEATADAVIAMAPIPRRSPLAVSTDEAADTMLVADASLPPVPRASPIARPMVAQANVSGAGVSGHAVAAQLAALNGKGPKTAADAIADAIGGRDGGSAPLMAYAPVDDGVPHIDAATGALVAGRTAGLRPSDAKARRAVRPDDSALNPFAQMMPVGYSLDTIALVMRAGSTRQIGYAELAMPHPFALPEFFAAPERSSKSVFGRVAYNGTLRVDRSASLNTKPTGTMQLAAK